MTLRFPPVRLILAGLLVMGCAVRLAVHEQLTTAYDFFYYPPSISDMALHLRLASDVAAGRIAQPIPYSNPGYYHLLGLVFRLGGDQETMFVLQMALGTLLAPALFLALRRAGLGMGAAAAAGVLLALNQSQVFHEQFLLLDAFQNICFLFLMAVLIAFPPGWGIVLAIPVLMGFLHVLRPNITLFWPVVLWWSRHRGMSVRKLVLMVALWCPVLLAVPLASWIHGGTLVVSTQNLGDNLFIGNRAGANGTFQSEDVLQKARQEASALPPAERTAYWLKATIRSWDSPWGWVRLMTRKIALVWGAWDLPSNVSLQAMEGKSSVLASRMLIRFGILAPLGLTGIILLLLGRRNPEREIGRLLAASAAVLTLLIALFFVVARFRLPLVVILSIGAGHALRTLVSGEFPRVRILVALGLFWLLINGPLDHVSSPEIVPSGFPPWLRY